MKKILFILFIFATSCITIQKSNTTVPPSKMQVKGGKILANGKIGYKIVNKTVFDDGHVEIICSGKGVNICPNIPKAEGVPEIIKQFIRKGENYGEFTYENLSVKWYDGVINKDGIEEFTFEAIPIK